MPTPATTEMKFTVSSRAEAIAWLGRRIRKLGMIYALSAVLASLAAAIVVGIRFYRRKHEFPLVSVLAETRLWWAVVVIPVMGIVVGLVGARYYRFAKRNRPIVESGAESTGAVSAVELSERKKGGVTMHKQTIVVQLDTGASLRAALEETEGSPLPAVPVGAPATVWTADGRSVAATSGALFESAT